LLIKTGLPSQLNGTFKSSFLTILNFIILFLRNSKEELTIFIISSFFIVGGIPEILKVEDVSIYSIDKPSWLETLMDVDIRKYKKSVVNGCGSSM
jgi:hypothetical protein